MNDRILSSFLEVQLQQAMALAAASDILELKAEPAVPPQRYLARFKCRGLIRAEDGQIQEANQFDVEIHLPDDYLRTVDPPQVAWVLDPRAIFHPNVDDRVLPRFLPRLMCLGKLSGGTSLVDILYQVYEVITYQKWAAHDGLNPAACEWARNNQHRFPVDRRPLKWKGAQQ